jgi:hypothetical protein
VQAGIARVVSLKTEEERWAAAIERGFRLFWEAGVKVEYHHGTEANEEEGAAQAEAGRHRECCKT